MAREYSKKIIIISENNRITTPIKYALNNHGLEIETEYLNLHSLSVIRKALATTGKTAFIRTELMRFIKERGFPYAIVMDGEINLDTNHISVPDKIKMLKTFLISYIILSRGKEFENLQGNFLLLTRGSDFEKHYIPGKDPHQILSHIKTTNNVINSFIDEMNHNKQLFNSRFFIKLLDSETQSTDITLFVDTFLKGIQARQKRTPEGTPEQSQFNNEDRPARVVYKIDENTIFDDGTITGATSDEYKSLNVNEFYIIGSWANKTQLEVSQKIARAMLKGLADRKRFSPEEEIVFNLDGRAMTDGTTALSIAQLFIKNLTVYKKVSIVLSPKNGQILRKAQGFSMIKNMVTVRE
ncbi:MAG TPA: hypothetical protein PK926_07880 [Spirochaetota bacterium]|nr:hypothetical protein [Spirochaetota bacterium]HPI90272.1 hypothetical protein [Spirochaetota bacterium]HPR46390.1 hypothetical protein [Spirochaetota bacterium]